MKKILSTTTLMILLIFYNLAFAVLKNKPEISITPLKTLIDQPLEIVISNLPPNQQITLNATLKDSGNNIWRSSALFEADNKGIVDVAKQAPISGSYKGLDPMGLLWSMLPINNKASHFMLGSNGLEILFSVKIKNKIEAEKTIKRSLASANIEKRSIREDGLVGTLFFPRNMQKLPGIIVVPGSSGGISELNAQLLASHGYVVFALGYFGVNGLPKMLENIDLGYFKKAISWLKKQEQVKANSIALLGDSRGGELVLLIASVFPRDVNAVVAYVPSSVVNGGVPFVNLPA
jgi:hypothetical protein